MRAASGKRPMQAGAGQAVIEHKLVPCWVRARKLGARARAWVSACRCAGVAVASMWRTRPPYPTESQSSETR